jgi:hypothetical protein
MTEAMLATGIAAANTTKVPAGHPKSSVNATAMADLTRAVVGQHGRPRVCAPLGTDRRIGADT